MYTHGNYIVYEINTCAGMHAPHKRTIRRYMRYAYAACAYYQCSGAGAGTFFAAHPRRGAAASPRCTRAPTPSLPASPNKSESPQNMQNHPQFSANEISQTSSETAPIELKPRPTSNFTRFKGFCTEIQGFRTFGCKRPGFRCKSL